MLNSLFARLFATLVISLVILVVSYSLYTAHAFKQLTSQTATSLDKLTIDSLEQQLTRQVSDSARLVDTAYHGLTLNVRMSYKILAFLLSPQELIVGTQMVDGFGKSLPSVQYQDNLLNGDFSIVDRFTQMTGGSVATLFVRNGDDFVRISTSLKKEDGSRAVGTSLDTQHPAYLKLKQGETYTGLATLFGKKYMTHYEPIMRDGKSVGILFVGYDATKEFEAVTKQLKSVVLGKTGYLFALDAKGVLVLHPTREGKNIADKKDVNGFAYIQEQLTLAKAGNTNIIRYSIPDKEGEAPRQKVTAYTLIPSLGWVLSSSAYPEEFTSAFDQAKMTLVGQLSDIQSSALTLLVIFGVMMLVVSYVVFNRSLAPLAQLSVVMKRIVSSGDLSQRAPENTLKEVGLVAEEFNHLIEQMDGIVTEAETVLSALGRGEFEQRIHQTYPGTLGALGASVNRAVVQVTDTVRDIERVMQAFAEGRFSIQVNDASAGGAFKSILLQAKSASHFLSTTLIDINLVMQQMNLGDFSARVGVDAKGELAQLKDNVNASMDRLSMAMNGITSIVRAQAEGDLTKECLADFHGQLKDLQNAINASARKLKSIVADSVDASRVVSMAASQVSQGAQDLSGRVQEQAAAIEQTSATMNEMTAAVQANTDNAKKVAELAHQVEHQAGAGVSVMQQTITAMLSIQDASSKIADIVTLIDSIAFQTNLLALNAAVEAARAGEHGRGFAVVAGEVRTLAQKSADAAKDIKVLIEDSVSRIESGTQLANRSGEMLGGITVAIEQVAKMIESIAGASGEQSTGIHQVHRAISDIDRVTQENAALVEETTAAAESLSNEAEHLRKNMAFFKTNS
jgi:methyl-accepting chemotaxis protein